MNKKKIKTYFVVILFSVILLTSLIALVLPPQEAHALTDPHGNEIKCFNVELNEVPCSHSTASTQRIFNGTTGEQIIGEYDLNGADLEIEDVEEPVDEEPRVTQDALDAEEEKAKEVLDVPVPELTAREILANRDVEDLALQNPSPIPEIDDMTCGQTLITNLILPFTMTVKYPQTLNADVFVSSNSPQVSEMKKIQDKDFFTLDTKNSTDTFQVSAHWEWDSKPRGVQFVSYEIYSDNKRVQQQTVPFDSLEYCHLFSIETELKTHVPTLEEFQKENDIQINNAFEVVATQMVNNNDLVFILMLVVGSAIIVIIMLIAILLYVNRDIASTAEETVDTLLISNNKVIELISAMKILARSDIMKNEKVRDSFISAFSIGANNISNVVIDLKNILHATLRDNPKVPDDIHLKSEGAKEPKEVEQIIQDKKDAEPKKKLFGFMNKKREEPGDKFSEDVFYTRYNDAKKYPTSKLEMRDSSIRKQYDKSPSTKLLNEINAISKIVAERVGKN